MVFSSLLFCTIFLPICLLVYYGLPRLIGGGIERRIRLSNYILLIFSLIFYAFGGVKYLALIGIVIFINWVGGFLCAPKRHSKRFNKIFLVVIVLADLGLLFFFKYFNLFIATIENIFFDGAFTTSNAVNIFQGV